jgi:hypothetical protein
MRKLLTAISLIAILILCWLTYQALYGPDPITGTIATHFDIQGRPNGYGTSKTLLLLPGLGILNFILMSVISRFPRAFNYPVRITEENRQRLQSIAQDMLAWIMAETIVLFAFLQFAMIHSARTGSFGISPLPIFLTIAAAIATTAWYLAAMRRVR